MNPSCAEPVGMRIFFSVGEPSGDLHGANLIKDLQKQNPSIEAVDVDKGRFHTRQHVLHLADVDVSVDLGNIVGGPRDVVLDQRPALEYRNLRCLVAD